MRKRKQKIYTLHETHAILIIAVFALQRNDIFGKNVGLGKRMNQTKRRLMDAYIRLMKAQPYDKIKIKDIAGEAGVQRSTFYQYFDGSYELLLEMEEELLENMHFYRPEPGRSPQDLSIYPSIEAWFAYCMDNREWIQELLGPNGDDYFEKMFREKLCREINQMMDDEGMPKDKLREYCVELNFGIYSSLVKFAMQTADMPGAIGARELAGLANNWRASAISAEKKSGLPLHNNEFHEIYQISGKENESKNI